MKRTWLILSGGLFVTVAAYAIAFVAATGQQRSVERSATPELAWLRQEFRLSDEQYAKVVALHAAYQPTCKEMCRRIDAQNARLQRLLAATNTVTPEIEAALADTARVRAECQATMLRHVYEVSRVMSPEQGRRYLDWVHAETILPARGVPTGPSAGHDMR